MIDKFYTKSEIAIDCWNELKKILSYIPDVELFLEPSAGSGEFLKILPLNRLGFDIKPDNSEIIKKDFFIINKEFLKLDSSKILIVGNPPFGKRGALAIDFFNHSAMLVDTIAFILPVNFRKYSVHRHLNPTMDLVFKKPLSKNSFYYKDKNYNINTEFQVWTRHDTSLLNLRRFRTEPISHSDFTLWQYNNTEEAMKIFKNDFDFAVPCQGWQDYSRRETNSSECEKQKQWMLIKAKDKRILDNLLSINYNELANYNGTVVPGFRKRDIIEWYVNSKSS